MRALLLLTACVVSTSNAQQPVATASVEGDVYLVMQNGDLKKGAGIVVYLLSDSDTLVNSRREICQAYDRRKSDLASRMLTALRDPNPERGLKLNDVLNDSLGRSFRGFRETLGALFQTTRLHEVGSGMNAHFRFEGLSPGRYILYGEWPILNRQFIWWAPISLSAGQSLRRDLDNSVEASTPGQNAFWSYCPERPQ